MNKKYSKEFRYPDITPTLKLYNQSTYKKAPYMRVRIEEDLDRAGDAFAVEILRALQFWKSQPQIVIQLCTGESPFIGYRKIGGDKFLEEKGLYNPKAFARVIKKYRKIRAILDNWGKPQTQAFLKNNGLNPKLKPDMNKVIAFAIDAIFPQQRNDYFSFANLLNNVCDLWGIPNKNRFLFYGDIYVTRKASGYKVAKIADRDYLNIIKSIDREGLKILEYQARCLLNNDKNGFALNSSLRIESNRVIANRLIRSDKGDFKLKQTEIEPLTESHPQYKYLENMRNQALMMHEQLISLGGAHITLLGVGPSYEGEGHIGFCERDTPPEQTCFIGAINDFDATFHIAGAHAKEFYGFKNMFVTLADLRMPRFGFITYGPADLLYRQNKVIVIVIATGNLKSSSVARAIEGKFDPRYPLSLTQRNQGVYILDKTSARQLRIEKYPWEFQPAAKENVIEKRPTQEILSSIIRPGQIAEQLNKWSVKKGDKILLINPHMDDDFLAMMHLLKEMSSVYKIYACYTSLGYTAVYSDYILGLLGIASGLSQRAIDYINPEAKENFLKQLIEESHQPKCIPSLDYEVLPHMSKKEKLLRATLLLIDLNKRYDLNQEERALFKNRFRNNEDIVDLMEFLARSERRKPRDGAVDIGIMCFLKTSARFMEAASSLMYLGIPYKNIYWPLEVSFYGTPGRPLAIKQEDINKIKQIIRCVSPKMVVFNGEGFPDFGSHSNTEIGTYTALFELLKEKAVKDSLVLFQWAGVWERIGLKDSRISVALTREELKAFYDAFNYFYPTQAPYAPVLNASSARPQSFAQDVIVNAYESAKEVVSLVNLPDKIASILRQQGGVLNYKLARLGDEKVKAEFHKKHQDLLHSRFSIDVSSNTALIGPAPYPEGLNELPSNLICQMLKRGAISKKEERLFGYQDSFRLTSGDLVEIVDRFHKEMNEGLKGRSSSLAMLPTFVEKPKGNEKGLFLAIDLGGTVFRVLMVYLLGKGRKPRLIIEKYNLKATEIERKRGIDYDLTQAGADELFSTLTKYIKMFLTRHQKRLERFKYKKPYPLGFTFSFSVAQKGIDKAVLKKAAKDFRMSGLTDKDVVSVLRKAIKEQGLSNVVEVVSLNNDAVGTLVTRRYRDSDCDIGGIVGTGTNFCYLELLNNIHILQARQKKAFPRKQMIINIESGNFDKIPQNAYDRTLDNNSTNRGEHITEKMVSGLYLGELTRLVMIDLIEKGLLFPGQLREGKISRILQRGSFPTPFLTEIAEDNSPSLKRVQARLKLWGIKDKHISLEDRRMVKEICSVVDRRAARITAAVIFAIVTHIDENIVRRHTIAIDGSVFEKHTGFKKDMRVAIRELSLEVFRDDRSNNVSFELTHDGSGIGAAIIAATSV